MWPDAVPSASETLRVDEGGVASSYDINNTIMANIILPPGWQLKENQVSTEAAYRNRRAFLKTLGLGAIGLALAALVTAAGDDPPENAAARAPAGSTTAAGEKGDVAVVVAQLRRRFPDLTSLAAKPVELEDVIAHPHTYRGKEIVFECVFHKVSTFYNPYFTRFVPSQYVNFSVWAGGAKLWEKDDYLSSHPFLFLAKDHDMYGELLEMGISTDDLDGIGMPAEDLGRIFEPFYTKKVMGRSGTGRGMAVVWGTVQDHRGYIDIESKEGEGTAFYLYFPVTRDSIREEKTLVPVDSYIGEGETVLIVDDIQDQRELASNMLAKLGYSAKTLSSGEEAIEYLKGNSVDLLVLDMIMDPGIDGLDTYKEILKSHPDQKAIIASGFSETDRVKEAQRLGAHQYIKKPYTMEKIGMAVKAELHN